MQVPRSERLKVTTQSLSLPRNRRHGDEQARSQRARRRVVDPALERARGGLRHLVKMSNAGTRKSWGGARAKKRGESVLCSLASSFFFLSSSFTLSSPLL